ncbi:MAG: hypothetical protein EHM41_02210 [Chloroflexi bacterium]|nr:MAG: hypothetical protein EHM41_02210 [Chloroflexota bacterium]
MNSENIYHVFFQKRSLSLSCLIIFVVSFYTACSFPPTTVATQTIVDEIEPAVTTSAEGNHYVYLPTVTYECCTSFSYGTLLIDADPGDWITPADVMIFANDQIGIKGLVAAGAPSDLVRDEWFGRLTGWTRAFIRGTYEQLGSIHIAATLFDMEDMYECIAYGPESIHQAGSEALEPLIWVPKAKELAETTGKCLIYGPAVNDYELMATSDGADQPDQDKLARLISSVAPYVDIWVIQLAKYQRWTDAGRDDEGNPYSMDDFSSWVSWWVKQIKAGNPGSEVWTQLGIGAYDPIIKDCLSPQPPEYILTYREALTKSGVNGIYVMPSQPCQNSDDPEDHEYYLQSLSMYQQAIQMGNEK